MKLQPYFKKLKALETQDPEIAGLTKKEIERQLFTLSLIASENHASDAVLEATGSRLTDKYSEGYPNERYYEGHEWIDQIEILAQKRALALYGLDSERWHVNVQPLSGSPANLAIYAALMDPCKTGNVLMGLSLSAGGHLTHGHKVSFSGKFWEAVQYGVNEKTGLLDYDDVDRMAIKVRPRVIVSGFTAYPRIVNFVRFGDIAHSVGAYHVVDMSHYAGLVAGGAYPSPFMHHGKADVVMTTTHKSLRGPRGAVIFVNRKSEIAAKNNVDLPKAIDRAVFPGLQGGPHDHMTAAKAVCFKEAATREFRRYASQVVKNAKTLAEELMKLKCVLVTGGTDNHLILLDIRPFGCDGKEAEKRLARSGMIANRNTIPGDTKPLHPSGIRIGTPAITTRGMKEEEMKIIALLLYEALAGGDPPSTYKKVRILCEQFPIPHAEKR